MTRKRSREKSYWNNRFMESERCIECKVGLALAGYSMCAKCLQKMADRENDKSEKA